MPRQRSTTLTQPELQVMKVLWSKGGATVGDVVEALQKPLAYTTVLTTLRVLESKGVVRHEQNGRAYTYFPILDRDSARQHALKDVVKRFFDNSPALLALNLLRDEELKPEEVRRLRKLLDQMKDES